jgi:uncharacterized membrane-anchored protein
VIFTLFAIVTIATIVVVTPVLGWKLQLIWRDYHRRRFLARCEKRDREIEQLDQYIASLEIGDALADLYRSPAMVRRIQTRGASMRRRFPLGQTGWWPRNEPWPDEI